MKVVVAGGSGALGRRLCADLASAGYEVVVLTRVNPTRALVEASRGLARPVPVWVQASTLAIYGDAGERAPR